MTVKEKLFSFIDTFNIQTTTQKPSEWAEANRIITFGSNFKGKWSYDLTPYMREPVDRLSPDDPTRTIALMAGSQLGKSHGFIFNGIGYIIKNRPTNILLTCGDDDLVKDSMTKIDEMIQNSGLRHLIRPNTIKKTNQKSGDTDRVKEFVGGMLIAQSIKAPDKIKQNSFEIILLDDIESAARTNTKNVGDIIDLALKRATSFNDTYKLCLIGVPEVKQQSIIEPAFLKGDQRRYFMPCPCCGEMINIIWYEKIEGENKEHAGVVFETDENGKLIESSVGYICQKCYRYFKETHKQNMLHDGKWIPTATPQQPDWKSYHLPALIAPRGFFNWTHYAYEWLNIFPAHGVVLKKKLQSFKNHVLAETYEERSKTPKILQLSQNTRSYKICEVPNKLSEADGNGKIVMLVCACDLNGKVDDARLDYEVLAYSETGAVYSVDHGSIGTFQRFTSEENRELYTYRLHENLNVWDLFLKNVLQRQYLSDEGRSYNIFACGVDTGNFTNYAYNFVDLNQTQTTPLLICGLKGETDKFRKLGADTQIYRHSKERANLYILEVNQIKDEIADRIELAWNENSGLSQPPGFFNFPTPSEGKYTMKDYFSQFESEHKVSELNGDGSEIGHKWQKRHSTVANHFWDIAVYNRALKDIFVELFLKGLKVKDITWGSYCEIIKKSLN